MTRFFFVCFFWFNVYKKRIKALKAVEISEKQVFCVRNTCYFAFESVPAFARPNLHVTCPCGVKLLTSLEVNIAGKGKKQRGGRRCVAGLPNGESCENNTYTENIIMHQFPTESPLIKDLFIYLFIYRTSEICSKSNSLSFFL